MPVRPTMAPPNKGATMMSMGSNRFLGRLAACAFLFVIPGMYASQNITNNGTAWSVSYDGDFLPNNPSSDPAWSMAGSGTVSGGILTFTGAGSFADMVNTAYWNGGSGGTFDNTVEFRMRASSTAPPDWRGRAVMNNAQNQWSFMFTDTYFYFNASPIVTDMTVFHTYRIVQAGNVADLYMDDNRVLTNVPGNGPTTANEIYFGQDITTGDTQWDYFRWTNEGAFIPEPSLQGLVALAVICFCVRRRTYS